MSPHLPPSPQPRNAHERLPRGMAVPLMAVLLCSAACVGLVLARVLWTGKLHYAFLVWNLWLAWLPLMLSVLTLRIAEASPRFIPGSEAGWRLRPGPGDARLLASFMAWLLLFPNAPYILTDLVHLTRRFSGHFWVDMVLILCCAITGLVLGFLSLYLLHGFVAQRCGRIVSWCFVAVVTGLSGFGVYLGRFLRFNSWDVVARPQTVAKGVWVWITDPFAHSTTGAFPLLFAFLLFLSYVLLYGLTHLPRVEPASPRA